ncbi:Crooked neck-like protein [Drosera capensis]
MPNYKECTIPHRFPLDNPRKAKLVVVSWIEFFGELGDVGSVQAKTPKKLKKRRQVTTEDGPAGYEEFIDYLFPEEAAYRWKTKQKIDESRVKYRDFIAADFC